MEFCVHRRPLRQRALGKRREHAVLLIQREESTLYVAVERDV
jgi:hypothetical protein